MDEKLDKERKEAYAARVKYDAALHDLSSVDADLEQIQNRLARLSDCERQYQAALSEKSKASKFLPTLPHSRLRKAKAVLPR